MARVLLIGVDEQMARGLAQAPELEGCSFQAAVGEADALRRLRRSSFDVVITNPGSTLEEDLPLVEEIRRVRRGVKLILLAPHTTPARPRSPRSFWARLELPRRTAAGLLLRGRPWP